METSHISFWIELNGTWVETTQDVYLIFDGNKEIRTAQDIIKTIETE